MKENSSKECIVCGEKIPIKSKICSHCKSYQSAWKNDLLYFSSIIGVLAFVAGAISFVISSIPSIRQVVAWHDEVKILTFSSVKPLSIVNIGDGEVYVSHLDIQGNNPSGGRYSDAVRIHQFLEPGEGATIESKIKTDGFEVVTSTNPNEIQNLLNEATSITRDDGCVKMVFATQEDPGFDLFESFLGEDMITFEVKAFVHFFSVKKQVYIEQEIPMLGYLVTLTKDSCKDIP